MATAFLFLLVGTATAGRIPKPDISIGLNFDHDTTTGNLGGAVPRVRWDSDEMSVAGLFDVQGGVDLTLTNIKKSPDTYVWGEAKRIFSNNVGAISIRGDMDANEREVIDLDLRVNGFRNAAGLQVLGSADLHSNSIALDKVLASTTIDTPFGGSLKLNPRYDLRSNVPDATIGYSFRNTNFKVDAQQKRFTLAHVFGKNRVVPTVTASGRDFSVSYSRDLEESGQVTTTWTPDDAIAVQWTDGDWGATIRAPLEGYFYKGGGIKVSMKRNVGVSLY